MIYWYIDVYGKRKRHEKRGEETEEGETKEIKNGHPGVRFLFTHVVFQTWSQITKYIFVFDSNRLSVRDPTSFVRKLKSLRLAHLSAAKQFAG